MRRQGDKEMERHETKSRIPVVPRVTTQTCKEKLVVISTRGRNPS